MVAVGCYWRAVTGQSGTTETRRERDALVSELGVGRRVDEHVDGAIGVCQPHDDELEVLFEPGMSCQLCSFTSFYVCVILANKMMMMMMMMNWTPGGGWNELVKDCTREQEKDCTRVVTEYGDQQAK